MPPRGDTLAPLGAPITAFSGTGPCFSSPASPRLACRDVS